MVLGVDVVLILIVGIPGTGVGVVHPFLHPPLMRVPGSVLVASVADRLPHGADDVNVALGVIAVNEPRLDVPNGAESVDIGDAPCGVVVRRLPAVAATEAGWAVVFVVAEIDVVGGQDTVDEEVNVNGMLVAGAPATPGIVALLERGQGERRLVKPRQAVAQPLDRGEVEIPDEGDRERQQGGGGAHRRGSGERGSGGLAVLGSSGRRTLVPQKGVKINKFL